MNSIKNSTMSFKEKIMYGKFLFGIFLHGYPLNLTCNNVYKREHCWRAEYPASALPASAGAQ